MAIVTLEGTEQTRGSCSIRMVEVSETKFVHGIARDFLVATGWEFTCDACDAFDTNLSQSEAEDAIRSHVCPDVPPCEADEVGPPVLPMRDRLGLIERGF